MKRYQTMNGLRRRIAKRHTKNRRGSTIIVVIGLMGLLLVLGIFAYTFARQSSESARYYADASKVTKIPTVAPEAIFDEALKQVLIGPSLDKPNSAFAGGHVSMVPNFIGRDMHPHNGIGFDVVLGNDGLPDMDTDFDGTGELNLELAQSPSAQGAVNTKMTALPYPDSGYTYPDASSMYLAYNGYGLDDNNRPVHVIIPSFHRPQYLRSQVSSVQTPYGRSYDRLTATRLLSLRPHATHRDMGGTFAAPNNRGLRFLHAGHSDFATVTAGDYSYSFPFNEYDVDTNGSLDTDEDIDGDGQLDGNRQGVWDLAPWQASTMYAQLDWVVVDDAGTAKYFQKTNTGASQSGASAPNWAAAASVGDPVTDGTITWTLYNYTPTYAWDADPDGDGIKEAIWLDLDLPVQEVGGKLVVPLVAFTIYDADGLLNMNIHGNTFGNVEMDGLGAGVLFGDNDSDGTADYISRSNLGMSNPAEVNPQYAFNANPNTDMPFDPTSAGGATGLTRAKAFELHEKAFGRTPSDMTAIELANMEHWFALKGRPVYRDGSTTPTAALVGRHGEIERMVLGFNSRTTADSWLLFPFAGTSEDSGGAGVDDDNNANEVNFLAGHPLDYAGVGSSTQLTGGVYKKLFYTSGLNNWPRYTAYYDGAAIAWGDAIGADTLMQNSINDTSGVTNEPTETILEDRFSQNATLGTIIDDDEPFEIAEMFSLHASNTDREKTGTTSRLLELMPWTLKTNTRATEIRKRLTTASWDLDTVGIAWAGAEGTADDSLRPWEFQANASGELEFPPLVDAASLATGATQPFRDPLRELMEMHADDRDETLTFDFIDAKSVNVLEQRRLNINQYLYDDSGTLKYRRLTTHPADPGAAVVATTPPADFPTYPPASGSNADLEWWARYERQQMARDVFVMLYVLGGGEDGVNYLETANDVVDAATGERDLYDEFQLREMAQFAVNMVDALDPDDVITKFEYEKTLSGGWRLDDNAYTITDDPGTLRSPGDIGYNPRYPEDSDQRGVVYGVEAQSLTLSEFLAIYAPAVTQPSGLAEDHAATDYNDTVDRFFTYLELRNASPYAVNFADENWEIRLLPQGEGFDSDGNQITPAAAERRLRLKASTVPAGGLFTIGTAGDATASNSYFRVDVDYDVTVGGTATFDQIAPKVVPTGSYFDLITQNTTNFDIEDGTGTTLTATRGALLSGTNADLANTKNIEVVLYRRTHLTRTKPTSATEGLDNPWVEVDRMVIDDGGGYNGGLREFEIRQDTDVNSTPSLDDKLQTLISRYREQPLVRDQDSPNDWDLPDLTGNEADTTAATEANTLTENNNSTAFTLWQPHFDRQFSSVVDLLSVPLYRPDELTAKLSVDNGTSVVVTDIFTALTKFLRPEDAANVDFEFPGKGKGLSKGKGKGKGKGTTAATKKEPKLDNRWYRIFSLIQVPSRAQTHATLAGNLGRSIVPGRINLNTIRYPEILAGLIDDENVFAFNELRPTSLQTTYMTDVVEGLAATTPRDWWVEFIHSRDQQDTEVTNFYLPGMPREVITATDADDYTENRGSRPFRDFSFLGRGLDSINNTVLRGLDLDLGTTKGSDENVEPRQLFQLGTWAQLNADTVDYNTRFKTLSKVAGSTTVRSHVFYVFMEVGFFEATVNATTGHTRIGAELETAQRHRGFYVVDLTKALEKIKPVHFRVNPGDGTWSFSLISKDENTSTGFDHNELVLHRQLIE